VLAFGDFGFPSGMTAAFSQRHTITPYWDWKKNKSPSWEWNQTPADRALSYSRITSGGAICPPWSSEVREAYVERELLLVGRGVLPEEPGFGYRSGPMSSELQRPPGMLVVGAHGAMDPYWCPARSLAKWLLNFYMDRKHLYDSLNCALDSPGRCANQAACYVGKIAYFIPKGIDAVVNIYLSRLTGGLVHLDVLKLISKLNGIEKAQLELYLLSQLGWNCNPSWNFTVNPVKAALPVLGYVDLNDVVGDLAAWGVVKLKAGTQLRVLGPRTTVPPITQALRDVEFLADLHKELFHPPATTAEPGAPQVTPGPQVTPTIVKAGTMVRYTPSVPAPPVLPPPVLPGSAFPSGTIATPLPGGGYRVAIPRR